MQIIQYLSEISELFTKDLASWMGFYNLIMNFFTYFVIFIISLIFCYMFYQFFALLRFKEDIRDSNDLPPNKNGINRFENTTDSSSFCPNGWIPILESRDVKNKEVKPVSALGYELVVFRGISGEIFVLDAFCPHLGANLGYGGKVVQECNQDCIQCPLDGWYFRGSDGVCAKIPGLDSNDPHFPNARIRVWNNLEINGFIYIWHHVDGQEPDWIPETINEVENSKWRYEGRIFHIINCRIQEIAENAADLTHFFELHTPVFNQFSPEDKLTRLKNFLSNKIHVNISWKSNWCESNAPNKHKARVSVDVKITAFGYEILPINFSILQIGPSIVNIRYKTYFFGEVEGAMILAVTPLEPYKNKVVNHIHTQPTLRAKFIGKLFLISETEMLDRDVYIWNKKKFLKNPILTKHEKTIVKFRRWYNQFYSESTRQNLDG